MPFGFFSLLYIDFACYWYIRIFVSSCPVDSENQASVSCSTQEGMHNLRFPSDVFELVICNFFRWCLWSCLILFFISSCLILIQRSNLWHLLSHRINILERGFRRWSRGGRSISNTCEEPTGTPTALFCQSWDFVMCLSTKLPTTRASPPPRPNLRRARARRGRERWRHRSDEQICPFWPWIAWPENQWKRRSGPR